VHVTFPALSRPSMEEFSENLHLSFDIHSHIKRVYDRSIIKGTGIINIAPSRLYLALYLRDFPDNFPRSTHTRYKNCKFCYNRSVIKGALLEE
jgi:hypothetical protein